VENETTVMKALIVVFIIGLVSTATICLGDFYKDAEIYDDDQTDTVEVPVVDTNIYEFNQEMIKL
jgi:hypothetical protein